MQSVKPLFIPTLNSGVTYWRMYNYVEAGFRNRSLDAKIMWWQREMHTTHPWQADVMSDRYRARILGEINSNARSADVVIMGMLHSIGGLTTLTGIRECYGLPVVAEMDDNILSCPTYNPASGYFNPDSEIRKCAVTQLRESDAIIVSTPHLAEVYNEFNEYVYQVPNCIDFEMWNRAQRHKNKGKITIGWAGGATHDADLAIIEPVMKHILAKYPNVEFCFVHGGNKYAGMKGVRCTTDYARIDKYPKYLAKQGFDIGIAPLVDNAFNRGKSNLRWLEYSALGIPTVASNVGHFAQTIHDGSDGMLCDNPEDFINALESLITDASKRKMMGQDAKARILKDFNVDTIVKKYATILQEIVKRGQVKRTASQRKDSNYVIPTEAAI